MLDAFFMTMITISTVGYTEVFPLSETGELFTVGLIVVGVGTLFYTAGAALEAAFENLSGRQGMTKMTRTIERLSDHYIICGFGRVGSATWELMVDRGAEVLVIEGDPAAAQEARDAGALVLEEDATHNETLVAAGINRARSLIACVTADSDNLVIVLSAKALRPDLLVIARAAESESERKLYLAGADRVVAPTGRRTPVGLDGVPTGTGRLCRPRPARQPRRVPRPADADPRGLHPGGYVAARGRYPATVGGHDSGRRRRIPPALSEPRSRPGYHPGSGHGRHRYQRSDRKTDPPHDRSELTIARLSFPQTGMQIEVIHRYC